MFSFRMYATLSKQVQFLTPKEKEDPISVLRILFKEHDLSDIKYALFSAVKVCLICDFPPFDDGNNRGDLVRITEAILPGLEAAKLILDRSKEKPLVEADQLPT